MKKSEIIQKLHLIISVIIVVPVALMYGFLPDAEFELYPKTTDESNFLKAVMGLYLGCSIIWLLGIFKDSFLRSAILTNLVFMLGLGLGRVLSIILDGTPTFGYQIGMVAEIALGIYGLWVFQTLKQKKM